MADERDADAARARAGALIDERRFVEAIEPAGEVCRLRPGSAAAWWNYAVALKHGLRWADCLHACERAIALDPGDAEGAHWNAGIAATALARWARAREAWRACAIELPDGDGPPRLELGTTPIRVASGARPEVVWCDRIDPCRALIQSVPLPESGHAYGDLVLHDGERRGTRIVDGDELAVFDELAVLEASPYGTWEVVADCATPAARDELVARFDGFDGAIEDWTASLTNLCTRCSLGEPHDDHDAPADPGWDPRRRIAVAARSDRELGRLRRARLWWRREVVSVERVR